MPRARDRFGRAVQAIRWAEKQWPCGRQVDVEWFDVLRDEQGVEQPSWLGQTYRDGRRIVIELKRAGCRGCVLDTALHEYSHAALWPQARIEFRTEDHPRAFWALYGEISDRWHHDGGAEEADEYEGI